ncbi:hypothetical protein PR048_020580 [Dryococelus australis]|uniref:Uncharacterized protein n=1 Tax=Dryococelus australis TaxID=614101 RepID=A0ABQ9H6Q6_9NEOP|nr:hypothetical protein PR048_020580 [Dryococelus australis]
MYTVLQSDKMSESINKLIRTVGKYVPGVLRVFRLLRAARHSRPVGATSQPTKVIEMNMERHRNEDAGETGDPRENPPTNCIHLELMDVYFEVRRFHAKVLQLHTHSALTKLTVRCRKLIPSSGCLVTIACVIGAHRRGKSVLAAVDAVLQNVCRLATGCGNRRDISSCEKKAILSCRPASRPKAENSIADPTPTTNRQRRCSGLVEGSPVASSWFETRSEIASKIDTENCCTVLVQNWMGDRDEVHFEPPKLAVPKLDPRLAAIVDKFVTSSKRHRHIRLKELNGFSFRQLSEDWKGSKVNLLLDGLSQPESWATKMAVSESRFSIGCSIDVEATPFLSALLMIGAHSCEGLIYWRRVTQGTPDKLRSNDKHFAERKFDRCDSGSRLSGESQTKKTECDVRSCTAVSRAGWYPRVMSRGRHARCCCSGHVCVQAKFATPRIVTQNSPPRDTDKPSSSFPPQPTRPSRDTSRHAPESTTCVLLEGPANSRLRASIATDPCLDIDRPFWEDEFLADEILIVSEKLNSDRLTHVTDCLHPKTTAQQPNEACKCAYRILKILKNTEVTQTLNSANSSHPRQLKGVIFYQHVGTLFANQRIVTYSPASGPTNREPFAACSSQSDTRLLGTEAKQPLLTNTPAKRRHWPAKMAKRRSPSSPWQPARAQVAVEPIGSLTQHAVANQAKGPLPEREWDYVAARPRSRCEGAIRATLTRTPSASSLLCARRAVFPSGDDALVARGSDSLTSNMVDGSLKYLVRHRPMRTVAMAVHDQVSTFEINLIKKVTAPTCLYGCTETPYDQVKLCRERKINIKASDRFNAGRIPLGTENAYLWLYFQLILLTCRRSGSLSKSRRRNMAAMDNEEVTWLLYAEYALYGTPADAIIPAENR